MQGKIEAAIGYSRMKRICIAVVLIVVVVALGMWWFLHRPTQIERQIEAQDWTLVRLKSGGEELALPGDAEVTFLSMGERRYVGKAAVNSYEVHLRVDRRGRLAFLDRDGGVTEMSGPGHLMDIESAYLAAFWQVREVEVFGGTLVLRGPGMELEYRGRPAVPIRASGSPEEPVSTSGSAREPEES